MKRLLDAIVGHANRCPDAPALVHAGEVVHTWKSLVAAVGVRAGRLRGAGVGPEVKVLLHRPASPAWVVDALAVWSVGGAIVPVDPALPSGRKVDLVRRARPFLGLGVALAGVPAFDEDGRSEAVPELADDPDRLAWLLFSSGSTGTPKGVLVCCGNYGAVLAAQVAALGLGPADQCAWLLSPGFDASLSDVGVALLAGAALHTEPVGLLRDPARLSRVLAERAITYADLPPRYLDLLVPTALPQLRAVLCGGEPMPAAGARRWAQERRLIGVYGPTEATICTSLWRVEPHDLRPHLGAPVAGATLRVVDDELWIGGPGIARGYHDDPARTADRFVLHDGKRWLRSGDRVRIAEDGAWLFDGRMDRQDKVDGRLVCPEEVEAALRALPDVTDARVDIVRRRGVRILEATVEGSPRSPEELRAALSLRLPAWMVPRVLDVGRLQRSVSGKAVRQDVLARVLCDVLGAPIAEGDSFAAAGLDSLRALDVAARLMVRDIAVAPEQVRAADCLSRLRNVVAPPTRSVRAVQREGESLAWRGRRREPQGQTVLLTGATGGLGARVLPRLLASGKRVRALVRAVDVSAARRRLAAALSTLGESASLAHHPALDVVAGALPDVSLDAQDLGLVVHLAAAVDLSADAARLRASNVTGTQVVAALAGEAGAPLLFASTLSVFVDTDAPRGLFTPTDPLPDAQICGGYAQTKLLAEVLVRSSDLSSCCVRYGLLAPDRRSNRFGAHDWLRLSLRGLRALGCVPESALHRQLEVDLTPVDHAAEHTVALAEDLLAGRAPSVAHVCAQAPATLSQLLQSMREDGLIMDVVDEVVFLDRARSALTSACSAEQSAALLGLVRGLAPSALHTHRPLDLFQATGCRFSPRAGISAPTPEHLGQLVSAALEDRP